MRAAAAALAVVAALAGFGARAEGEPDDFDFYVLALSWSPTWCATGENAEESRQCGRGFGFLVHGLWPQYEQGYPEYCGAAARQRIPAAIAEAMSDLMPDRNLVFGEWRKHGSCAGLSPEDYFGLTRAAYESISIPPALAAGSGRGRPAREIESAFAAANPGLSEDGIAISCERGRLDEVRICLTRDLAFRACEEVDARGCRDAQITLPAPR